MQVDERKTYLKVKLRNLKRKYAKIKEHADLGEEAIELKAEIDNIERKLNSRECEKGCKKNKPFN